MVNAPDVLKTAFGILKSNVGQKLVALFFVIQFFNFAGSILAGSGSAVAGFLMALASTVVGIIATIGGFRAFREGEIEKEMFTENLIFPLGRIIGANLVSTVLAYALALLFLAPAYILAVITGVTPNTAGLSGMSAVVVLFGAMGIFLAIGSFFYVAVTLLLAQPLIASDDRRMFQALDESIRRTEDERLHIFLALLGLMAVYILSIGVVAGIGGILGELVTGALTTLVVAPLMTTVGLSMLNYLVEELPEAE
ncbi:MAG: hypothetical protein ABEJ36_05790 [Candidatus Nanosalina sp.]